jgi:hypothetical protein
MTPDQLIPLAPVLQWGFAGFCLLLLGVLVWFCKQLIGLHRQTIRVVTHCTHAMEDAAGKHDEMRKELREMRDEQLRHGCPFRLPAAPTAPAGAT